jgi:hypothetical protein
VTICFSFDWDFVETKSYSGPTSFYGKDNTNLLIVVKHVAM